MINYLLTALLICLRHELQTTSLSAANLSQNLQH
jgi:hypothetical protein